MVSNPLPIAKWGERAQGEVGEPASSETGQPEGCPTKARPMIEGAHRRADAKKPRCGGRPPMTMRVAKPGPCCFRDGPRIAYRVRVYNPGDHLLRSRSDWFR